MEFKFPSLIVQLSNFEIIFVFSKKIKHSYHYFKSVTLTTVCYEYYSWHVETAIIQSAFIVEKLKFNMFHLPTIPIKQLTLPSPSRRTSFLPPQFHCPLPEFGLHPETGLDLLNPV